MFTNKQKGRLMSFTDKAKNAVQKAPRARSLPPVGRAPAATSPA